MKLLSKHNLYVGTNAERLASFATPPHEGADFFETDTGDSYVFVYGNWEPLGGGGGATTFLGLTDTPGAYTGAGGQMVVVNGTETGLEFTATVPAHDIVGASHTATGAAFDVVGLTAVNTLGLLTPSSDPNGTETILKTNSDGDLWIQNADFVLTGSNIYTVSAMLYDTFSSPGAVGNFLKRANAGGGIGNIEWEDITVADLNGTGNQYDVIGFTATNVIGVLTPDSDATPEALVRYDSDGSFSVEYMAIGSTARVNSTGLATGFDYSGTGAAIPYAASLIATLSPSSAPSYSLAYGWRSSVLNVSTETILNIYAISAKVEQVLAGVITNAFGVHVDSFDAGAGSIGTAYGLKIENQSVAGTNYGIHTGSGLVSLGDNLEFRQAATISTTTGQLTINGVGGVVFNGTGADSDFRVESDNNANMLFIDAGNNGVGIGTNSLSAKVHVVSNSNYATGFRVDHTTLNTGTSEVGAWVVVSANPSSAPGVGTTYRGLLLQSNTAGSTSLSNVTLYGALMQASHANSNTLSTAISNSFGVFNTGGGTITTAYGAAIGGSNNGTITTYQGINISQQNGTVGTQYGIFMNNFNSATTNYAIYTNAGQVRFGDDVYTTGHIGVGAPPHPNYGSNLYSAITANAVADYGILGRLEYTGSVSYTGRLIGYEGRSANTVAQTVTTAVGILPSVYNSNAGGTVTNARAIQTSIFNTGTIGTAIQAYISNPTGGGTITTNYGIFVVGQTAGTTNYAIYTGAGTVHFGDNVGFGVTAPRGRLHGHDGTGGFIRWSHASVDGTAQTVISNGTGDVLYDSFWMYTVRGSSGVTNSGSFGLTPGLGTTLYNSGGNTLTFNIAADGSVTVQRTAGALTYRVALWGIWL